MSCQELESEVFAEELERPKTVVNIISRREWGALRASGEMEQRDRIWPYVLWTFSNSEPCYTKEDCIKTMQALQKHHMDKGLPDIQYNFYFGGDGNIYEGRGWTTYNTSLYPGWSGVEQMNIGLAYLGKYENQNYPNQEVLELRKKKNIAPSTMCGTATEDHEPPRLYTFDYHKEYPPYERKATPPQPVISRWEWGAIPPTSVEPLTSRPVLHVGFEATRESPCASKEACVRALQRLQRHHMNELGFPDIAYNFVICADNLVFEGRGWTTKSDKVNPNNVPWDGKSVDIGYIGVFDDESPPLSVLDTRDYLVSDGIDMNHIDRRASYFN